MANKPRLKKAAKEIEALCRKCARQCKLTVNPLDPLERCGGFKAQ